MKKILLLSVAALFVLAGCVFINMPRVRPLVEKNIGGEGADKILIIDISGVIMDDDGVNILGMQTDTRLTARVKEELELAKKDKNIKAVIVRINTPGGSVTACDIIHHELKKFKAERGVPVVSVFMDMAASGGYFIASATDRIIAHPTTVTGSIGVIAFNINASGLLDKIGLSNQTVKSGPKKDIGSPLRPMTDDERAILQSVIDRMFERFVDVVVEGRKGAALSRADVLKIADGRIFAASQALDLKLVDGIGYMDDAVSYAKEAARIKKATLVTYSTPGSYRNNYYSGAGPVPQPVVNIINIEAMRSIGKSGMNFMYLWMP